MITLAHSSSWFKNRGSVFKNIVIENATELY